LSPVLAPLWVEHRVERCGPPIPTTWQVRPSKKRCGVRQDWTRQRVEDVIIGCAIPEGTQGFNIARMAAARAGLPVSVPAQTVNRFCSSGLQTIATAAERIMAGFATTIVAGGTESMSSTLQSPNFSPNPELVHTTELPLKRTTFFFIQISLSQQTLICLLGQ
jgi:acetyl-CoA acetyltransferase